MKYATLGNPIWSGQLVLLGGWRRILWSASLYALIAGVACAMYIQVDDFGPPPRAANGILRFLAFVQLAILFASAATARNKALTRDHQSLMIESIRTAPLPAGLIVLGYVFGPVVGTIATWLAGVLIGAVLIVGYGLGGMQDWLVGNLLLLFSVMTAWMLQVFLGVGFKKPSNRIMIAYVICFVLTRAEMAILILPGLPIFLGFHSAWLSMTMMQGKLLSDGRLAVALAGNLVMAVFWWWAAARRLRRPDLPALSTRGAFALCGLWLVCSVVGFYLVDDLFAGSQLLREDLDTPMTLALSGSMLLFVAFPISSALQRLRISILESRSPLKEPRSSSILVAMLALSIMLGALWLVVRGNPFMNEQLIATALILVATTLTFHGLLQASIFRKGQTITGWTQMVAFWILPAVIAGAWQGIQLVRDTIRETEPMSWLFTVSPVGGLITIWSEVDAPINIGTGVQFAVAVLAMLYGFSAERKFRSDRQARLEERRTRDTEHMPEIPASVLSTDIDEDSYSVPSNKGDDT
ncbi:MAG: hypothetical protein R3E58_07960 [Phycisphaerae bacterium]